MTTSTRNPQLQRHLYASLHDFTNGRRKDPSLKLHFEPRQGLFVYDIDDGHRRLERFPAETWESWNGGWAGVAAHAGTGVFYQLRDGRGLRAFDIAEQRLLWERDRETEADRQWATETGRDIRERSFQYVDRRFCVTRNGRFLVVPDRDSAKREDKEGNPLGLGLPVLRVLDATTGEWVKNIPLVDPDAPVPAKATGSPHNAQAMTRYIYASMWNDGHVFLIDPEGLELVRRIGPVELRHTLSADQETVSDAVKLGTEEAHGSRSIQHFSVAEDESVVYVEPVKTLGIGIVEVESGDFLGHWPVPDPEPGSLRARRMATPEAEANQLHSKPNHGIAVRPNSDEVWTTDDRWGFLHIWKTDTHPPRYDGCILLFDDIRQPIYDFSWVNFSLEGDYAYGSEKVIDANERKVVATLDGLNEASIELQFDTDGRLVRTGHEMGSGLDTWIPGFGPED